MSAVVVVIVAVVVVAEDTPLHQCVEHGLVQAVSVLLSHGSDVNYKNKQGLSSLHVALQVPNSRHSPSARFPGTAEEIVHCLVKEGYNTDVNLPDALGMLVVVVVVIVVVVVHCVQEKHPLSFFFYISLEKVWIYTKFSGNVYDELSIPSTSKLNIHCY